MFKRLKNWLLLKLAIWKINSLRRTIKKFGWVKSERQLDSAARQMYAVLWGDKPFQPDDDVQDDIKKIRFKK